MEGDYLQLSASHKQLLPHYLTHLDAVRRAVDTNYKFISNIVASGSEIFKNSGMSISVSWSMRSLTFRYIYIVCIGIVRLYSMYCYSWTI